MYYLSLSLPHTHTPRTLTRPTTRPLTHTPRLCPLTLPSRNSTPQQQRSIFALPAATAAEHASEPSTTRCGPGPSRTPPVYQSRRLRMSRTRRPCPVYITPLVIRTPSTSSERLPRPSHAPNSHAAHVTLAPLTLCNPHAAPASSPVAPPPPPQASKRRRSSRPGTALRPALAFLPTAWPTFSRRR